MGAVLGGVLLGCAGYQAPQGRAHTEAEVSAELRAQAADDMACAASQLQLETAGPERYSVRGCGQETTYCCHDRTLEVFCEDPHGHSTRWSQAATGPECQEPPLEAAPDIEPFEPQSQEDWGLLL